MPDRDVTDISVLHLTITRVLYGGQRRQLEFEFRAAQESHLKWETIALHIEAPRNAFERRIPRPFRGRLLLRVYGWITAIRLAQDYDIILLRDMQLDLLGPFLGLFVRNRITVHHAKEIEELGILRGGGWSGRLAAWLERFQKPLTMRSASGLAGVTAEIRDYEATRFPWLRDRTVVMPNGYLFAASEELERHRESGVMAYAFVCAEFSAWHGLDKLLSSTSRGDVPAGLTLRFHLVGELTPDQSRQIQEVARPGIEIICHGQMPPEDVASVLMVCDVAIGSLALDRKGLREASTLKVREYLASGLPVYATHKDAALPDDFPYFFNDEQGVSIERLVEFTTRVNSASRSEIRESSRVFLDKGQIMRAVMDRLKELLF